jgi:hypothetical protein
MVKEAIFFTDGTLAAGKWEESWLRAINRW